MSVGCWTDWLCVVVVVVVVLQKTRTMRRLWPRGGRRTEQKIKEMCTRRRRRGEKRRRGDLIFYFLLLLSRSSSRPSARSTAPVQDKKRERPHLSLLFSFRSPLFLLPSCCGCCCCTRESCVCVCVIHEHAIGRRSLLHPFFFMGSSPLSFFLLSFLLSAYLSFTVQPPLRYVFFFFRND